ncbi:hypothetical protein EON65_45835 [archaeon]|nr:MAG: hypothetical protein EON65_45835 [archaeon]
MIRLSLWLQQAAVLPINADEQQVDELNTTVALPTTAHECPHDAGHAHTSETTHDTTIAGIELNGYALLMFSIQRCCVYIWL